MLREDYIATRVNALCKKHGYSKYRLSQLTGMTQTALGSITSNSSIPTIPTLDKICGAFGITLSQFFAEGDRPDLTTQQTEILDMWDALNPDKQKMLLQIMRSLQNESNE